jgi:hypothetical protein
VDVYREHIELIRIGELDSKDRMTIYTNISDDKSKHYLNRPFYEPELYKEMKFLETIGYSIQQREIFISRGDEYLRGKEYRGLQVDRSLMLVGDPITNSIQTSTIKEIISENMFITMNSVYFIRTPQWRRKSNRTSKIKELLNGKSTKTNK